MRDKTKAPPARAATAALARPRTRSGVFAAALAALAALALAPAALAVPFHPREEARDIAGLNHACAAAVDSKGDVYLSSAGTSEVKVYDASHNLLTSIPDSNQPCGIAVTTTGNLYVSERATGEVVRFKPNVYPFAGTPTYGSREVIDASGEAKGIAVDPFDNRLYVAEGSRVSVYEADGSFGAHVGEGTLTEASGVAAYTYRTSNSGTDRYLWVADASGLEADRLYLFAGAEFKALTLRRELKGTTTPAGSFGFGAAGAYLAADPGNREAAGEKCVSVAEQACTAGHLFLYDAAHKALDEFDASGEYLDQTRNAAFADAEPTALAIDRSGGAGDGTVYVTAGAGGGAKALALGPLKAPSRKTLEAPISHVLAAANSVATDSHGDVYAVANAKIHVYKPDGTEIKTATKPLIEDKEEAFGIAVDSTGKVYVLDEGEKGFSSEAKVTYYTPSAYPPVEGTTYERHASPIATPADFPPGENILKAIAVNPGPGAHKDRLFVTSGGATHEYDSAANGSGLLNGEFAKGLSIGIRQSIAVDGHSGNVYFGDNVNAPLIAVVSPDGKEILTRINEAGGPKGPGGANAYVAVDQANGHVLEFDGKVSTAREYDAAGGFVAEFGNFTEGLTRPYRIAVDSACVTHEPPLDETTTPTCHEYDPANGNAYVAFDDSNPSHPPYDVTAFGPLAYPAPVKHKLTVKKTGTGSGTVTSSPAGINCGAECSAEYEETEVVTLMATPNPKSEFKGWEGCEAEPSKTKCEVTMSKDREVVARFEPQSTPKFKLTVKKTGTGSGTVTSSPAGINCGAECSAEYEEGTEVTLSASPGEGSAFSGWSGSGCSGTGTCKVTMSAAREVTASFTLEQRQLSVTKKGTGSGTVTSSPAGINCGAECSAGFDYGTTVTLTGTSGAKTSAVQWAGCGSVNVENKCLVTMTSAKSVTATFDLESTPKFKLTVKKTGTGSGTVTSSPAGINCGAECSAEYEEGTEVTLSASPGEGSAFSGWSGSGCSGTGTCKVTMSAAREVTASFTLEQRQLSVTKKGTGSGTVTSSPAGINCGAECSAGFDYGTTVTLTGTSGAKTSAVQWAGCGSVNVENKCLVTMTSAKSVTATFDLESTPKFKLTVKKTGTGSGTVTSSPAGINCGAECSAEYEEGTEVTLSASPGEGSAFSGWSGSGCSGTGTCKVTMSAAREVTASFTLEQRQLSVTKKGTGSGTVTSSPAGINCGAECSAGFDYGTTVTLTGTSGAKTSAVQWAGCGSVNVENKCLVTMTSAKSVTATFDLESTPKFKLTVKKTGTGSGTVTSSPAGINCGAECSAEYEEGTEVTLSASPGEGSAFSGWSGSGCSGTGTCKVTMSAAREVTASFTLEQRQLSVTKKGTGSGTVTSSPAGINCGAECSAGFDYGTTVTLTGTSGAKTSAVQWAGCGSVNVENKCLVTMTSAKSVTATFDLESTPKFKLTVKKTGTGSGTVTSSPAGINCGAECSAEYEEGTEVTLSASPGEGSAFSGWSGSGCSGTGTCKVTMSAAREVTASFEVEEAGPVNPTPLTIVRTGEGTVVSSPGGIECGSTCSAEFELNSTVSLTASPASGWAFGSWSGCATHEGLECTVTMSAAKTVKASFFATPSLTVEKAGPGSGKVIAKGISCDAGCSVASAAIKTGTLVEVKATPSKGSEAAIFESGTGSASSCSSTCVFTITEDSSVKVRFDAAPMKDITVDLTGPAAYKGKVKGKAFVKGLLLSGISCGSGCTTTTESFFAGDNIELTASAATGYTFEGWTVEGGSAGTCTGKTTPCSLPVDASKTVKAEFK